MRQLKGNTYELVKIPIDYDKKFLDFSTDEIKAYFDWFMKIKNQRLRHLCTFVFDNPEKCLIDKNLSVLEILLINSVYSSPKSSKQINLEMNAVPIHFKNLAQPADYVFDRFTISICFDIGIFIGELITNFDDKIFWKCEFDKTFSDYGQPVLAKERSLFEVNPFVVVKNATAKIHKGTYSEGQIPNFFIAWKKAFKVD